MKPFAALPIVAAILVAGCGSNDSIEDPVPTSRFVPEPYPELVAGCLFTVCNANESSRDYGLIYDKLGLRQINFDPHREWGVGMGGDLVVWQIDRQVDGADNSDVFAYNISQDRLYAIGWESYYWQTLFEISDGYVVVKDGTSRELPEERLPLPRRAFLRLWSEHDQSWQELNTSIQGGPTPFGFDAPWVVFENSDSSDLNNSGFYAVNIETGRLVPVYVIGEHMGDPGETAGATVVDGVAYYEVHTSSGRLESWLHEVDLATGNDRVVHHAFDFKGYSTFMRSSGPYVVWYGFFPGGLVGLYLYDRETGQGGPLTDGRVESLGAEFSVAGEWAVYSSAPVAGHAGSYPIVGMHIPTKTRHILVEDDPDASPLLAATDGKRFVTSILRNDSHYYDTNGSDLYWGELPKVE